MKAPSAAPRAVSLPMYLSRPDALEAFWDFFRQHMAASGMADLPKKLQWPGDLHEHWLDPDLFMSQACGYPLVTSLKGKVRVIGTFRYLAQGCDGHLCRSAVVVSRDCQANSLRDLRGRVLAFNSTDSQSGYNALRAKVAKLAQGERFFSRAVKTDSHQRSLEQVSQGQCDLAALDCVTLAGLRLSQPELWRDIRVLEWSDPYPGLPLITSAHTSDKTLGLLRQALAQAMLAPELTQTLQALLICGFVPLEADDYRVCINMRHDALALGCAEL